MLFIHNIRSVAKYESKILLRSWFFKVFTVLAILLLTFLNFGLLVSDSAAYQWEIRAIPSNIPYMNLLLLNTGQAVIAIFLASEFLKRDKKLDTSEVFYVRPLSNAEYVIGKIWGNLKVFLVLNVIILAIALLFNCIAKNTSVDWSAYVIYFFLISIPTLIFIIGLAIFLMLVLKNQALTFILLLGYIGLTVFYIQDKFYYVFDYMAYSLPLLKSTLVGFSNWDTILIHRGIYLLVGLGFIFFTIFLFRRLPNSARSHYPWLALSALMILAGGFCAYKHVYATIDRGELRRQYLALNNQYVHTPKMVIEHYDLSVTQEPDAISSTVGMKGKALESSDKFTFCLNPGLQVKSIRHEGKELRYTREKQILIVDFGTSIAQGDSINFSIDYKGKIDESLCYLDVPDEVLQKQYTKFLFNIDKRYTFQTSSYLFVTPENYWYPRPGTGYSDESPDWQQTYFSRFKLQVKPLPGLVALSQGESTQEEDGTYTFTSEYPYQSISLIIGNYKQKSTKGPDSTLYSIFYLEGHDFFSAPYDTLTDTIPTLIQNFREDLERNYKLSYPFRRLSLVESPAQLSSYPRTWSQAQEVLQPELILFPEKGFAFSEANLPERQKKQIEWSRWGGPEISQEEALMRATNDFFWIFRREQGNYNFSSGNRGQGNITSQANPYFIFPMLYNFRYNIFSSEWPIANRLIELYLQKKSDNNNWERQINGISNNEKANLLMEKRAFKELLSDVEHRDLTDNIISLKAFDLFAHAELNTGISVFRDSLYSLLEKNTFRNIQFEPLLDTLSALSGTQLKSYLPAWSEPTPLPLYSISQPEVIRATNRDEEMFQVSLSISNNSDYDGIIDLQIALPGQRRGETDDRSQRKVALAAHETKRLVSHWEDAPRSVNVNTLISGNLPNFINQQISNIRRERNYTLHPEGDYVEKDNALALTDGIIVDNEDSLFFLSEPDVVGLLPKWLDKVADSTFQYSGISWWRAPIQWTATTNAGYYGKYVRSAYVVKSGNGSQTATWRVPIPATGQYEVYYYVYKNDEVRNRWNRAEGEYHFQIKYDEETEDAYINLRRANDGWEQLGVYFFDTDTVDVVLTNECKLRSVTADAVKFVKR